jgi:hypothetical protein
MISPSLTSYQTLENSQGTLDPLGLYSIADRLASRLTPDLRERMKHPRYLTAIAVGAVICSEFDEDELAIDELSSPWQVYEWYVASGLVKRFDKDASKQLLGLPGREKTTRAMKEGLPLSAIRYLKTPTVFGFHGVYRTLAKGIGLIDGNQIGDFGAELVDTWQKEQSLNGFRIGISGTAGIDFRKKMEEAVRAGLKTGAVAKPWTWEFYNKLADSLAPKSPGKEEAALLYNRLLAGETASRAELMSFLLSPKGQDMIKTGSEKNLHTAFLKLSPECKPLLLAIQSFEEVCRLLYNAFYEILQWMEAHQNKAGLAQLSTLHFVKKACNELQFAFNETDRLLEPYTYEAALFSEHFALLRERFQPADWVKLLFEHHFRIQKNKPPNGKAPWVLEHSSNVFLLNTSMASAGILKDDYVHQYRGYTLQSFMKDLGKIEA